MKIVRIFFLLLLYAGSSLAQNINLEIKGVRIGMTREEVSSKHPSWQSFTLAGARPRHPTMPVFTTYRDGRLDEFIFFFTPDSFDAVLAAFKDKYPALECKNFVLSNVVGATFEQTQCFLSDADSILRMQRYVKDPRTARISLHSRRFVEEEANRQREEKKDI